MTPVLRRASTGAAAASAAAALLQRKPPGGRPRWQRTNYRGSEVSLLAGPALAGALALGNPALAVAALGAGAVGAYDDAVGGRDQAKGVLGHLRAVRDGRLTGGAVKVVGVSAAGAAAAGLLRPRTVADVLLGGAVIAGTANLLNLLDLRPGRALKVGVLAGCALGAPGIAGSCAALLPADLAERTMLGDAGANALGAAVGVALVSRLHSRPARAAALLGLGALTAASERVSFSAAIDASPALRWFDQLGRRG